MYLALCLQPPVNTGLGFRITPKVLMLCWALWIFGRAKKGGHEVVLGGRTGAFVLKPQKEVKSS